MLTPWACPPSQVVDRNERPRLHCRHSRLSVAIMTEGVVMLGLAWLVLVLFTVT